MYHPTTRVLTVLELLQSHGRMSGPELAERLEVNIRTIRHYVTLLQDIGIPVEAERGRGGAYRLRPGFKLPPLLFTEDEAVALTLGLLATRRMGLTAAALASEGALAKVERVLPEEVRARVQALQQTLQIELPMRDGAPDSALVVTLSTAVQQQRRIRFSYQSWRGEATERAIDPYGVVYCAGRWYTAGFCHLRNDLRAFRLDRMRAAGLLDTPFVRPAGFDCLAFVMRSLANTPATWPVEVLLHTDLDTARRLVPADLATLEPVPAGVLLRCQVQQLDWLARFLVGLGCALVVRHPPELRAELHTLAARAAALADAEE